jgi:hypothetical protein
MFRQSLHVRDNMLTDAELLELGREVMTDPTCRWMKRGTPPRPLTNLEMFAASLWAKSQIEERIERDGCCGGRIGMAGTCSETGHPCPLWKKSKRIEQDTFQRETDT